MHQFTVPEMTCGGCAKAVTRALQSVDPQATVQADLHRREVTISSSASKQVLLAPLHEAGYPAEPRPVHMG